MVYEEKTTIASTALSIPPKATTLRRYEGVIGEVGLMIG